MGDKGGRPLLHVDWDQVEKLIGYQCTQEEVADFLGLSVDTLERASLRDLKISFAELWKKKRAIGRVKLRKLQFEIVEAKGPGASTMAIYLDKKMFPLERVYDAPPTTPPQSQIQSDSTLRTFEDFCVAAGYPAPYRRQVEMCQFGLFGDTVPRLLLGTRGYGKTEYITILGIAYAIYLDPAHTYLIITKSAVRNTALILAIAKALKANGVELEKENSREIRVNGLQRVEASVEAITIKGSLRSRHPHTIVMDDPVTDEDVSEAMRILVKKKYDESLKLTSDILIIGQPAHAQDLYALLRKLVKKMLVKWGEIPELDHDLEAQRLAGVDEKSIQASYFLEIVSDGSAPFEKINYLDQYPVGDSVAFLDPSHKGKDASALSIMRMQMQGMCVVGFAAHRAWNHWVDVIFEKCIKYGVKRLIVETNGLGDQPVSLLQKTFHGKGIGVVGVDSTDNKHARIMAAGNFAHRLHLSKESDQKYIDQVIQYEYGSKHDDAPDSLATCLQALGFIKGKTT